MRLTAQYAITQAQAHAGDPKGQFATVERLLPLLQAAQDELILAVFSNETVTGVQGVVVLPSVPAGTTSLAAYFDQPKTPAFGNTGQLAGLFSVMSMKERQAGSDDGQWIPMSPVLGDLPTVKAASNDYNAIFKFMGNDILMPGSDRDEDFRIYGQFVPFQMKDTSTPLIPRSEAVMGRLAAAYLMRTRNRQVYADLYGESISMMDHLFADLCREKQDVDIHQVPNPGYPSEPFYI